MTFTFPAAALDWLLVNCGSSLLVLADSMALPSHLARRGYQVYAVHRDANRLRAAQGTANLELVAARGAELPFSDCHFDAVIVHQVFPDIAPGLALPELARMLRPEGNLLISHLSRDSSVPWVKRLSELMHSLDAAAMSAPSVEEALADAQESQYFCDVESQDFRHWELVTQPAMLEMVAATEAVTRLDDARRQHFLDLVKQVYSQAAGFNTLRLPYRLRCWRGRVVRDGPDGPDNSRDPALVIPL